MRTFPELKSDYWLKLGKNFFCPFVETLNIKFFTEEIFDLFLSLQKSENTVNTPKNDYRHFFFIKFQINQTMKHLLTDPSVNS